MISLNQVIVQFGGEELFKGINLMINPKDRLGLVGKNGAGKSTLLKLLINEISPEKGIIQIPNDISFGYLPQQMETTDSRTLIDETRQAFEGVKKLKQDIDTLNQEIANRTDYESDDYLKKLNLLTEHNEKFDLLGGHQMDADIEKTLLGLGFKPGDFDRHTAEFSGGWRMRIELGKILLRKPDVLLLDEPTNHLDIESIQWLEDYIKDFQGAVVLISHDRAFLDNVTKRTVEITMGILYDYKVPYSEFLELRKERRQTQLAAYENQQKLIEETERFIERFRYKATKAVQVQSRIKQLEKIERIEIDEFDQSSINIKFPPALKSGSISVEAVDLSKSYDQHHVLDRIEMIIERGEKVAFVGKNGEGKTTLARIIMQELDYKGGLKLGHNLKIGYFAQNQAQMLDRNKTVFQTIDDVAVGEIRTRIRDILGAFLFGGEDIDKKVSVLSGGEKARLAMAKLLLEPYSMLLLDEPTNHLDLRSKEVLKQALLQYEGTLILVSHDRDFLDGLVSKVFEFKNRKVKEHLGGIYDFLKKRKLQTLQDIERNKKVKKEVNKSPSASKLKYEEKKELERKRRKINNKISASEARISEIEKQIADLEMILATPENIKQTEHDPFKEYENLKASLQEEMNVWEKLAGDLEEFEKEND